MNSIKRRVLDSQEEYLKSKLLLEFVKKCVRRPEVSPDLKLKILSIIHEGDSYLDENLFEGLNNILGIHDDLISKPSEFLTGEQAEELRKFLLIEMRTFHSFCNSVMSEIKQPPTELSPIKPLDTSQPIMSEIFNSFSESVDVLRESVDVLREIETLKADADSFLKSRTKEVISESKKRMLEERQIFDKIAEAMTSDSRGMALEEVEQILESAINKNRDRIEQLKFELREYHAIDYSS